MKISCWFETLLCLALLAVILVIGIALLLHWPLEMGVLVFSMIVWSQAIWPYLRTDGPRHMVFLPNGSRPFYERRGAALIHALWGYLRDPERSINGFPRIDAFWESHLPD